MQTDRKCLGCGLSLQYEDSQKEGYAVKEDHDYCQACFKLKHYGVVITNTSKHEMPIIKKKGLIVLMTSVLHLDQLFAFSMQRHYPDFLVIYLINHVDLLPKDTNLDRLLSNIKIEARKQKIFYSDIILMSAVNKHDIEQLKQYLKSFKKMDIYLMGLQNSGKTTLFKELTNQQNALAMKKAGLTQEEMIGQFEHLTIHDMPGLYKSGYLHELMTYNEYKRLIPDQTFKPRVYLMQKEKALYLENLVSISHKETESISFVFYVSDQLNLRRFPKHLSGEEFEQRTIKVPVGKQQVTFADFGFMHLMGPTTLKMSVLKGLHLSITKVLFND
ncbi:MAG: GTPase [Acholeplasmataceae bacterium]